MDCLADLPDVEQDSGRDADRARFCHDGHPAHVVRLQFARGVVPSPHGDIAVDWQRQPDQLTLKVAIPPGSRATVALPIGAAPAPKLASGGKVVWSNGQAGEAGIDGLLKISKVGQSLEMEIGPGSYKFVATDLLLQSK